MSGSFGKLFITNLRWGCINTNNIQNTAKYIIYGVKIDNSIANAKAKQYIGLGRFSPWIFDPNQSKSVGQNTSMISGVPDPAKNKNGVDKTIRHDANKDTLLLNQRLSNNINKNPSSSPTKILGNFIV